MNNNAKINCDKYVIYHITSTNETVEDFVFEADSRDKAKERYDLYVTEHINDGNTYLYKIVHTYIIMNKDGSTKKEFTSFTDMILDEDESIFERISNFFRRIVDIWKTTIVYPLDDMIYWLKNYDKKSSTSHMRCEYWSLDRHLLNDIAFNIPIIKQRLSEKTCGIPDNWCRKAREQFKQNNPDYEVPIDILNCCGYTDEEMTLASKLWTEELNNMLKKIGIYEYYDAYGYIDDAELLRYMLTKDDVKELIPYYPGTITDIEYEKLNVKIDDAWNDIWDWFKEHGRSLWI